MLCRTIGPGRRSRPLRFCTAMALTPTASPVPVTPIYRGRRRGSKPVPPREEASRPPWHARWIAIYEALHALRERGISRPAVYAYLQRDTPPGPRRLQRPPSARVLTPDIPYLICRWRRG